MRKVVAAAFVVALMSGATPVLAQDEAVLHEYPYTAAETQALFADRPEGIAIAELVVEGSPQLEIIATTTEVIEVRSSVVYTGVVDTCPSRLWYSVGSSDVADRGDGTFDVTIEGSWDWQHSARPAPQDICRDKQQEVTTFTMTITVALEAGVPVVVGSPRFAVPAAAGTAPQDASGGAVGSGVARDGADRSVLDRESESVSSVDADASAEATPVDAEREPAGGRRIGRVSAIGLLVAMLLLMSFLAPSARGWWIALFDRAREWARRETKTLPWRRPDRLDEKTYDLGDSEITYRTTIEAVPPVAQISGSEESNYRYVYAPTEDGRTTYRLETGTDVEVIRRESSRVLVRPKTGGPPVWVDASEMRSADIAAFEPPR